MKAKNLVAGVAALALAVPLFTSSAFAAWDGGQTNAGKPTEVSYDNSLSIPDPDNPTNPTWAITVPSSIKFTDANKKVDASVSMNSVNGGAMPGYIIHVGVKSAGGYKLAFGTNQLDYDLQYSKSGTMTSVKGTANKVVELGSFTANLTTATTIQGTAILSGTATATGSYTDSLTYVISKNAITTP